MNPIVSRTARGLAAEGRRLLIALRSPWLASLLLTLLVLLTLVAQAPLNYTIDIGREEGYGADLPLIDGFYPFEPEDAGAPEHFRWSTGDATIKLPGIGQRSVEVSLRILSVNGQVAANGAKSFDIVLGDQVLATVPVVPAGATFSILVPPSTPFDDQRSLQLRMRTISPTGDSRDLGLPFDTAIIRANAGPLLPPLAPLFGWLGACLLAWLSLVLCGFTARTASALLLPLVLLLGLAALLDPLRTALGPWPALNALTLGLISVIVLRYVVPRLAHRLAIPLSAGALSWLLLLALAAFVFRYGGKIYPDAMQGDIGFHANRFAEVSGGRVLLLSRNRGVDFPYPPALYLLLAPFTLLGFESRDLLRVGGALCDAASPLFVYTLAISVFNPQKNAAHSPFAPVRVPSLVGAVPVTPTNERWALVAAALYSFSAATFMTTWWNFSTHIFTQSAHLLLVTALIVLIPRLLTTPGSSPLTQLWPAATALAVLASLVFLGHFGFWMNTTLLGGFALLLLLGAAWRGRVAWRVFWALALAFAAAEVFAVATFYSAYTSLFLAQARATSTSGLTGMAGRGAVPREQLWRALWDSGFRIHFGFFPVPLAAAGFAFWLARRRQLDSAQQHQTWLVVATLLVGTFLVAAVFAALPFLSGSSLSTRWLMFSAWAVALCAVTFVRATWRFGWLLRLVYLLMAGYVLWITASQWIGALGFRIRPPEPF